MTNVPDAPSTERTRASPRTRDACAAMTIPLVPIADANAVAPLVARSRAFDTLAQRFAWLALREPPPPMPADGMSTPLQAARSASRSR